MTLTTVCLQPLFIMWLKKSEYHPTAIVRLAPVCLRNRLVLLEQSFFCRHHRRDCLSSSGPFRHSPFAKSQCALRSTRTKNKLLCLYDVGSSARLFCRSGRRPQYLSISDCAAVLCLNWLRLTLWPVCHQKSNRIDAALTIRKNSTNS